MVLNSIDVVDFGLANLRFVKSVFSHSPRGASHSKLRHPVEGLNNISLPSTIIENKIIYHDRNTLKM